jgi:hypothetical protein
MSLVLKQLGGDDFQYANVSPLPNPPWTPESFGGLQVVSDQCTQISDDGGEEIFTGVTLPNDQYAQFTLASPGTGSFFANIEIRTPANFSTGYEINLEGGFISGHLVATLRDRSGLNFVSNPSLAYSADDVFQVVVVGAVIRAYKNGTLILNLSADTATAGFAGIYLNNPSHPSTFGVTNFVCGSAAYSGSINGNAGLAGATLNYSGTTTESIAVSGSVVADENGNYTIPVYDGTYTVTPVLAGFAFTPTSQTVTVGDDPVTGINFTAYSTGDTGKSKIPLPFSKRTTAAVVTFACLQQAKLAQTLTTNATTIGALVTEQHNLFVAYRKLQRQDVANQAVKLNDAIGDAQTAINALNTTVQGMSLPVPPPDDAKTLVNIQAAVGNAVRTMSNVVADE